MTRMNRNARRMWNVAAAALGVLVFGVVFAGNARAGCGDFGWNGTAITPQWLPSIAPAPNRTALAFRETPQDVQPDGGSIVGMWKFKFIAQNSPPIPDGTLIDAGFAQWHSDGTEITNSSRDPRTGNFCLGVWTKTGASTYKLAHQALN